MCAHKNKTSFAKPTIKKSSTIIHGLILIDVFIIMYGTRCANQQSQMTLEKGIQKKPIGIIGQKVGSL